MSNEKLPSKAVKSVVFMKGGYLINIYSFNCRVFFRISRDKDDPKKSVLPAVLYVNTNHNSFTDVRTKGFMIAVGWWDFSIKFGLFL